MQPTQNSETNRTPKVEPALQHTVPWRLISVAVLPDARLRVTFVDGTTGEVDLRAFLSGPKVDGTVFEPLRDPAAFAQVQVVLGAIQWPNGADLAPDAMYDAIREYGVWVLQVLDNERDRATFPFLQSHHRLEYLGRAISRDSILQFKFSSPPLLATK